MKQTAPPKWPLQIGILVVATLAAVTLLALNGWKKLDSHPVEIDLFTKLGMEPLGRYLIGGLELLASVMLLIPQGAAYGALLGFGIMIGAVIGHLGPLGLGYLPFALLVLVCCGAVMWIRRHDVEFLRNLWDHYDYDNLG